MRHLVVKLCIELNYFFLLPIEDPFCFYSKPEDNIAMNVQKTDEENGKLNECDILCSGATPSYQVFLVANAKRTSLRFTSLLTRSSMRQRFRSGTHLMARL